MEKLKSIAKSIWAKIPKTKTEFKDLFDKCVSYYEEHKAWIHRLCLGIISILWGFILLAMLSNFFTLYFSDEETLNRASEVRLAIFTLTAWIGAPFLVWRTMIASKQAETAQEQATIAQEKSYTELFTQAVEQLGSEKPEAKTIKDKNGDLILDTAGQPLKEEKYVPNIEVRVGAIYALERIMKDSDKDVKAIIDTLATYVKHNCGKPKIFDEEVTEEDVIELQKDPPADRYDIQTALTIIGRRPEKYKTKETMPDLSNVNLQGANLVRFDLTLCNLANAHLEGTDLQEANLREANLKKADLKLASLDHADLREANFQEANLQWAELQGANLQGAELQGAELQGANLQGAELQGAELQGANLQGAELQGAELQGAELQGANLQDVQITDAHKTAASVIWVDFTKVKYDFDILQEQVKDMFGHKTMTILPEGMKVPDHWSEADMDTYEGYELYMHDWEAFKKEKGVG